MPNNFRLTGDYYVSKSGSDANSGLTPELPKLTVQAGLNLMTTSGKTLIIGAGVYKEDIVQNHGSNFVYNIRGDGNVIFQASNLQRIICNFSLASSINIYDIEFRNSIELAFTVNFNYGAFFRLTNCVFNNCNFALRWAAGVSPTADWGISYITNCKFINSSFTSDFNVVSTTTSSEINKCIFINSQVQCTSSIFGRILNSYIDSFSVVRAHTNAVAAGFNFNNIQGKIIMNTNGATSGVNSNGVAQSFAQHRIDYPTYNLYSISANPLFNDPQRLNFTLQSTSPHIKAASDYVSNIGGTEYAVYKSATSTELTSGATISGLTLRGNNSYTITSSPTPGTIETAPIFLQWPATKPLTKLEWAGVLEFNKSITAGTSGNNNVPDWDTYTTGAGASPDRLTVKMRFSTQQTQPTTSAQWDNGGYWTAGNYELFEVNSKPKVDSNGKGNGDPAYIETSGLGDIVPTWIQLNVKLIDTYNP